MNDKNIIKLTENSQKENLEKYLRPQWSWKIITFIISAFILLTVVTIDLEINFINLFTDFFKYFADILSRMLPPDFSNFNDLVYSMIETIEIAILGISRFTVCGSLLLNMVDLSNHFISNVYRFSYILLE